jgi:hypothetical protein
MGQGQAQAETGKGYGMSDPRMFCVNGVWMDAEDIRCGGFCLDHDNWPVEARERYDELLRAVAEIEALNPKTPPKQRPRKPRLDRMIAQAEKASGKRLTSITTADGTTLHFGEPEPTEATNPWLADLEKRKQQ